MELSAIWNGKHPETGDELVVEDGPPEGALPNDLPPQPDVFAGDYAPDELEKLVKKLRKAAGLPNKPTGAVADA